MTTELHRAVARSVRSTPIVAVVRTEAYDRAQQQARAFVEGGLELIEVTFSVPRATRLVRELLENRDGGGPPFIGMGTVANGERARQAVDAGAEFIVSPNASAAVAQAAREAGLYLILGSLSPTEIVEAHELGADLIKVFPLPPVGGPHYLETIRAPLSDLPMLAGGGFGIDDIPAYRQAGASAFGIGAPMLGATAEDTRDRIQRAIRLARGETEASS